MSSNQNAQSVKPTHHRQLRLVDEATPGVRNPVGAVHLCDDLNAPFTVKPVTGRKAHNPQGANGAGYVARHRGHVELGGLAFDLDYLAMKKWLDGVYVVTKTVEGAQDVYRYRKTAYENPAVLSRTAEIGAPEACDAATLMLLSELSWGSGRKNEPSGSAAAFAQKPTKNVEMTGAVAGNAVLAVNAAGVTGPGVFSIGVGSAAAQNVTLAIGDTTAQTATKLATVGLTANVAGTVNVGAGEIQRVNGTGNTFTIYDDIVVDTATATLASVQTAVRAKPGRGSVVVSGTITAPVAGTPGNTIVSGGGNGFVNGTYVPSGTFNGAVLRKYVAQGMNVYWSGTNWRIGGDAPGVGSYYYEAPGTAAAGPPATGWTVTASGAGPAPTVTTAADSGATPGASNLTFTYDAAAGNVTDLATTSAGYTATNTQPGAAGGGITISVTTPANTPVSITFVSGTGWSGSVTQAGGNGTVVPLEAAPITAADWTVKRALTYAALAGASVITSAYNYGVKISDIHKPHYTANGTETYDRFITGKRELALDLAMDDSNTGDLAAIEDGADNRANRVSLAAWWELKNQSGDARYSLTTRVFASVSNDIEIDDDEDAEGRKFTLMEIVIGTGQAFSCEHELRVPAGTFAD